ncbi:lipocalin family protein [Marinigracilibium pacificum]|uniref:Lipocalin-like domain-containing protein n=1 Tax=Marinigracilibium pacificum TaxID=2729599 RepID=A0A848IVK6_9BACT|nr:lipocalin family protein [Marinigracilibium pacificum]NMM47315.1 hypothetical protein [Marinigracilibium pacificum]
MNKFIYIPMLIFALVSCANIDNKTIQDQSITGNWTLHKMIAGRSQTEFTGSELGRYESYTFRGDKTFTKTVKESNSSKSASGNYSLEDLSDGKYIKLEYDNDSELIDNCTGDQTEYLRIEEKELIGGSAPCDGPMLIYTKAYTD